MQWDRVVNTGADTLALQKFYQAIAIFSSHDVQVINGSRPCRLKRRLDGLVRCRKELCIFRGTLPALLIPLRQMLQLHVKNSALNGIQASIVAFEVVIILLCLAMVAQHAAVRRNRSVVGCDRAPFAASSQVFARIKAEGSDTPHRSCREPTP